MSVVSKQREYYAKSIRRAQLDQHFKQIRAKYLYPTQDTFILMHHHLRTLTYADSSYQDIINSLYAISTICNRYKFQIDIQPYHHKHNNNNNNEGQSSTSTSTSTSSIYDGFVIPILNIQTMIDLLYDNGHPTILLSCSEILVHVTTWYYPHNERHRGTYEYLFKLLPLQYLLAKYYQLSINMMKCLGNLVVICPNSSFVYHLINKVGVFGVISEMMLKERDQDREKVREYEKEYYDNILIWIVMVMLQTTRMYGFEKYCEEYYDKCRDLVGAKLYKSLLLYKDNIYQYKSLIKTHKQKQSSKGYNAEDNNKNGYKDYLPLVTTLQMLRTYLKCNGDLSTTTFYCIYQLFEQMILSSVELPESNSYSSLQTLSNELLKTLNHILFSYNYTLHSQTIFIILKHLLKQFMEDYSEYCTNYKLMLLIVLNNNMANGMCLGNDELELFGYGEGIVQLALRFYYEDEYLGLKELVKLLGYLWQAEGMDRFRLRENYLRKYCGRFIEEFEGFGYGYYM